MASLRSSSSRSRSPCFRLQRRALEVQDDSSSSHRRSAFVTMATGAYLPSAVLLVTALRRQLDDLEEQRSVESCQECDSASIDVVLFVDDTQADIDIPPGVAVRKLLELEPLPSTSHCGEPIFPHFRFCWQKLGLWALVEYEIVVYLDADILLMGDVTPLLSLPIRIGEIAAVPACQCWRSETCNYTDSVETGLREFEFNAGVLVLRSARCTFNSLVASLKASRKEYAFAEQDFLNEFFKGCTLPLHPKYNMLKFAFANKKHAGIINIPNCVCLHFIMAKPWERASKVEEEFTELHKTWLDAWTRHERFSATWRRWQNHVLHAGKLQDCIYYVPDYSSPEAVRRLLSELHSETNQARWQKLQHRSLQCWGGVPHPEGSLCDILPEFLASVGNELLSAGAFAKKPTQYLVNTYMPGEGIDAHSDGPLFLPNVVIFSLEGQALLRFKLVDKRARPDLPERFEVFLQPMSLLVFRGDVYNLYIHSIAHSQSDVISEMCLNRHAIGAAVGQQLCRGSRRTSITIRCLRNVRTEALDVEKDECLILERQTQWDWWVRHLREFD